jgi:hypothetical protein
MKLCGIIISDFLIFLFIWKLYRAVPELELPPALIVLAQRVSWNMFHLLRHYICQLLLSLPFLYYLSINRIILFFFSFVIPKNHHLICELKLILIITMLEKTTYARISLSKTLHVCLKTPPLTLNSWLLFTDQL